MMTRTRRDRQAGSKTFRAHLDEFDMLRHLAGEVAVSPLETFFSIRNDVDLLSARHNDWKADLVKQRSRLMACWAEPFVHLKIPKIFILRRDPFERADENSNTIGTGCSRMHIWSTACRR
jgi:hypothetical protein